MTRAFVLLSLFALSGAAACVSTAPQSDIAPTRESHPRQPIEIPRWTPIALSEVVDPNLRRTLADLLMFVDSDILWPGFALHTDPVVIVDSRNSTIPVAYCVGQCAPVLKDGAGTSRLWRAAAAKRIAAGEFQFMSMQEWGLGFEGQLVAADFSVREQTVATALHEHFHLHFQSQYANAFGDEIESSASPSGATRDDLADQYARANSLDLQTECVALVGALAAGTGNRATALTHLRSFIATREQRRSQSEAPTFEEDFWERQEGIPTNLERRAALRLRFQDPSVIGAAFANHCSAIPQIGYFLLLGALEAAVLDTFGDPNWPQRVYPTDGSRASSLYSLVRSLATEEEGMNP